MLVSIALTVAGVFITNALETYMLDDVRDKFTKVVQENMQTLQGYDDLTNHSSEVQIDLLAWSESLKEELFVIDDGFTIVASSNTSTIGESALDWMDQTLILQAFNGNPAEVDEVLPSGVPVKNLIFPIEQGNRISGLVVIRADVSDVYDTQEQAKAIFARAMAIALAITAILSLWISRSIASPIKDVTRKAQKMAEGDFSQEVTVQSDDEIGQLAQMFNLLRGELDKTIGDLESEKTRQATIFQYMADGLLAIDRGSRNVLLINPAAKHLLELDAEVHEAGAFPYSEVEKLFGPQLAFDRMWENSKEGGYHDILEYKGKIFALRYDRFKDDEDRDVGLILILQDITEQQKAENMQRDFVANVSHELKTPLTTIKSYTETMLDGAINDTDTAYNFLSIVDSEADRMNRLVKDLLQLSRLDHKQEKMTMQELDIVPLVHSCAEKVRMTAHQKEQTVEVLFGKEQIERVVMDKDRIEQVLQNILSNAIKYTPEGGKITLDLREERDGAGKLWVLIEVADNGIGIAETEQQRVFERFYRVDKARSRAMGGTGLGLSIARQIMEEHGGSLSLRSPGLNQGTTVTIRLPHAPTRGQRGIE